MKTHKPARKLKNNCAMSDRLRVTVTAAVDEFGPIPFSFVVGEGQTVEDLVDRLKGELQARKVFVEVFAGPVSTSLRRPLRTLVDGTLRFTVQTDDAYVLENGTSPTEYFQAPPRPPKATPAKAKSTLSKRVSIVGDRSLANPRIATIPNVSCHKCRQRRTWVYACPNNEKHRFCARCLLPEMLEAMETRGCPLCLHTCPCCICAKRECVSHLE